MTREVRAVEIADLQRAPADTADVWLRLHLLSATGWSRRTRSDLDGVFGLLTNVVWTSAGPCAVEGFEQTRLRLRARRPARHGVRRRQVPADGRLRRCPTGVRIADADRVRLGAHLAEGTTVMHEGFVNYNAGTLGASMVEGRISRRRRRRRRLRRRRRRLDHGHPVRRRQEVISIGERCLLGANAGIGISLGDDCVVEAGCYVTAGTKVTARRPTASRRSSRRASCPGASNVLFRRNSRDRRDRGRAVAAASGIELNAALHAN